MFLLSTTTQNDVGNQPASYSRGTSSATSTAAVALNSLLTFFKRRP